MFVEHRIQRFGVFLAMQRAFTAHGRATHYDSEHSASRPALADYGTVIENLWGFLSAGRYSDDVKRRLV
jgi:hypothetical protein